MSLSKLLELVKHREVWCAVVLEVKKSHTRLSYWTTTTIMLLTKEFDLFPIVCLFQMQTWPYINLGLNQMKATLLEIRSIWGHTWTLYYIFTRYKKALSAPSSLYHSTYTNVKIFLSHKMKVLNDQNFQHYLPTPSSLCLLHDRPMNLRGEMFRQGIQLYSES